VNLSGVLLLFVYVLAAGAYAVHFSRRDAAIGRTASVLLLVAALGHTFIVGMQTVEVQHVPFANPSNFVSTFVWAVVLSYLYVEIATNERAMGAFITPIVVALQTIPTLFPGVEVPNPALNSPLFWVHVASLVFAYASFALAGVLGIIYVLQFKEIKAKHLGYFYTRLPPLNILDAMNSRAVTIGWTFLTAGVVVGVIWARQAPDIEMMSLGDPKIFVALLTWVLYSFAVVSRRIMGWNGRRAAWLSAAGFAIVLLNPLVISYFVTTSHSFQ
jgi:ABC-type transport system involved in cytochrome c biogenesis permease subunit